MVKVGLIGLGKTGSVVAKEIILDKSVNLSCVIRRTMDYTIGRDIGDIVGLYNTGVNISHYSNLKKVINNSKPDVIIDFSSIKTVIECLPVLVKYHINLVICSTNVNKLQLNIIRRYSKKIGIVMATTVTEGINIVMAISKLVKKVWPDAEIAIIETHHSQKRDTSRTAINIAETLKDNEIIKIGRRKNDIRSKKEIVVHSIRAGGVVGKHTVIFGQPHQTISITHESIDRHAFGKGAIRAARWVKGRKGFYNMSDVLDLRIK
ncbi:MAG: 4-hydroxy-tetrahydrodipicolinate reductase [Elusimicrobia bacterium]|nr:4-hydroxy-tetrahydrodipicolinate reductase [Elusimicrobiota bacterium]